MKRIVPILSLLFILTTLYQSVAYSQVRTIGLRECIAIALGNATSVAKANNNLQLQGADVLKGYGSFLPKVSSSASYLPTSVNRGVDFDTFGGAVTSKRVQEDTVDLSLTTSLNLFNGLSDYAALQSALDLQRAAGYSLEYARHAVVFDVTQNYYQTLLDRELAAIAKANLRSARDLLTLTERQFEIGLKPVSDLYQQQADVGQSELSLIQAENRARRSRLELLRRLRIDPLEEIDLLPVDTDAIGRLSPDLDIKGLATESLANRNDLRAREFETEAAGWQVRQASGNYFPKLDLAFTIGTGGIGSYSLTSKGSDGEFTLPSLGSQLEKGTDYTVSLNLTWNIFDGFLTRYNVESSRVSSLNRKLDYADLKNDIVINLRQAAGDYQAAFTQIATAKTSLRAAESAFAGVQRRYELGATGFVELSNARSALFTARSNLTQAAYNLVLQKAVIDFTTGRTIIEK